jgi:hypothetical protein
MQSHPGEVVVPELVEVGVQDRDVTAESKL